MFRRAFLHVSEISKIQTGGTRRAIYRSMLGPLQEEAALKVRRDEQCIRLGTDQQVQWTNDWIIEMPEIGLQEEYGWFKESQSEEAGHIMKDRSQSSPSKFLQFAKRVFEGEAEETVFTDERTLSVWVVCCHGHFMKEVYKQITGRAIEVKNYAYIALHWDQPSWSVAPQLDGLFAATRQKPLLVLVRHCPRVCQNAPFAICAREHLIKDPPCQEDTANADMVRWYQTSWRTLVEIIRRKHPAEVCISSSCLRRAQQTAAQFVRFCRLEKIRPVFWKDPVVPGDTKDDAIPIIPIIPYCKEQLNYLGNYDYKDMCSSIRTISHNHYLSSERKKKTR